MQEFSDALPCCVHCGKCSRTLVEPLLKTKHAVCYDCYQTEPDLYRKVTKTQAMHHWSLTAKDLSDHAIECGESAKGLRECGEPIDTDPTPKDESTNAKTGPIIAVVSRPNPKGFNAKMKLYYEFQLKQLATWKFGSAGLAERAVEVKSEKRLQRALLQTACGSDSAPPSNEASTALSYMRQVAERRAIIDPQMGQDCDNHQCNIEKNHSRRSATRKRLRRAAIDEPMGQGERSSSGVSKKGTVKPKPKKATRPLHLLTTLAPHQHTWSKPSEDTTTDNGLDVTTYSKVCLDETCGVKITWQEL